jgi:lysophospholipase L1-like esterase
MNIVCFGDSITHARAFAEGDRWPTILQSKLEAGQPGRYKVYNRGIGGNTTAQGLERVDEDVLPYLPGFLLVQFGFNDSNIRPWSQVSRVGLEDYRKNLREFHRIAAAHESQCAFIVNHLPARDTEKNIAANGKTYSANFAPYNEAVRQVAKELGVPTIDLPRITQERQIETHALVSEDGVHLSVEGNHLYADMIFERLNCLLGESSTA